VTRLAHRSGRIGRGVSKKSDGGCLVQGAPFFNARSICPYGPKQAKEVLSGTTTDTCAA
jgi:hypothetical protein